MRAHAIVIGIDGYTNPDWRLNGAVRDAIDFARWAVTAGGVDPANLTLLLSPHPDDPPLAERLNAAGGGPDLLPRVEVATRKAILQTFFKYSHKGAGKDADRLWFYYGGHGLAPTGEAPTAGPLVVPADVDDLEYYVTSEPVGLQTFRGQMEDVPPSQQFYFVDACRDVLPPVGNKVLSQQLVWYALPVDKPVTQAILFATTAGQRAKELRGYGLFSRALVMGLRGLGPEISASAAPPVGGGPARWPLHFNALVKFVRDAVVDARKRLPDIKAADAMGIGLPVESVTQAGGDIAVVDFELDELPTANITLILDPQRARQSARIEKRVASTDQGGSITATEPPPVGPPVPELATFELRGGKHWFCINAPGFEEKWTDLLVYEDKRIPIELDPAKAAVVKRFAPEAFPPDGGLESVGPAPETTGTLIVDSADALARVSVTDGGGKELGRNYGRVMLPGLSPGPYRVVAELTSTQRVEQIVQVRAGETSQETLRIPGLPLNPALAQELASHDIQVHGNYSDLSENFGPVANARLGSILAYAAWAARWPPSEGFARLRAIGVDPISGLEPRHSAVQVLIGGFGERGEGAPGVRVQLESVLSGGAPLATAPRHTIIVGGDVVELRGRSQEATALSLSPIPGLAAAQQASAVLEPGPIRVRVEMPGFSPASFAVSLIPGFITVLVISREDHGDTDVQQYLNPIDPMVPVAPGFDPPSKDDVRLVELAWRALEGRDPLDAVEHQGLIHGKRSNPLLGIIAGYRMFRSERAQQFRVLPAPPSQPGITESPLWNLVQFFPGIPDVHVLAGLYDPDRRDEHFGRAMRAGTPVLVEGFWTLVDWLTSTAMAAGVPPPTLAQSVLPGTVWTGFTEAAPALAVESVHILPNAGRPSLGDRSNPRVLALAKSVGRLGPDEYPETFSGSTFLIAPRLVVCPIHVAVMFGEEHADGKWTLRRKMRVRFDLANPAGDRVVTRVVRALRPPPGAAADGGSLEREVLDTCWPVLLELAEPAAAPAMALGSRAMELAQRVAVIGFPMHGRLPEGAFARYFAGAAGEKHFMPGTVVRSAGSTWTFDYDCFTADGTSGGPVVDLETGDVVGMHVAAYRHGAGRERGIAVALTRFADAWPEWA